MNIFITGMGFIGGALAKYLTAQGHCVFAGYHKTQRLNTLPYKHLHCDFTIATSTEDWINRLERIDLVINTIGIIVESKDASFEALHTQGPIALFEACIAKKIRCIQISALGANEPDGKPDFLRSKALADDFLWQQQQESIIVYPSIVIGRGGASTALFYRLAALPLTPLIGKGEQQLNPIHIDDLCSAIAHMIQHWPLTPQKIFLSGTETFSLKQLLQHLRAHLGFNKILCVSIPEKCIRVCASLCKPFHHGAVTADTLTLLNQSKVVRCNYDDYTIQLLSRRLACEPLSIDERMGIITSLLVPVLWLSLAFLWIFTGITSALLDTTSGYQLLNRAGIEGDTATFLIYAGAATDFILGVLMLLKWRWVYRAQITLMFVYMIIVTFVLPAEWLNPLGTITKNIPIIVATLMLHFYEKNKKIIYW